MQIESGPYKGYYTFNVRFTGSNGLIYDKNQPFMKTKLDRKILGFNKTLFPYVSGEYYVPWDGDMAQIDLRKMLYALENKLMPSTGNTEIFEREFNRIIVPDEYCPKMDPCNFEWCLCHKGITPSARAKQKLPFLYTLSKYLIIFVSIIFIIWYIVLALS